MRGVIPCLPALYHSWFYLLHLLSHLFMSTTNVSSHVSNPLGILCYVFFFFLIYFLRWKSIMCSVLCMGMLWICGGRGSSCTTFIILYYVHNYLWNLFVFLHYWMLRWNFWDISIKNSLISWIVAVKQGYVVL